MSLRIPEAIYTIFGNKDHSKVMAILHQDSTDQISDGPDK
jgi:hypothetical protein